MPILVVDHLKKEKRNKMAKFNYTKWITENKYGKFNEDTLGSENPLGLDDIPPELAKAAATKGSGEAPDAKP